MAELVSAAANEYAERHTTPVSAALTSIFEATKASMPEWGMMVGAQEGRFLEMLVFATGSRQILEIGCFTGYSAVAMAGALAPGGSITTCELDPARAELANANIASAGFSDVIKVIVGPALETLADLSGPFDLVFIDADKESYGDYFEAVLPKLAPRGLIVADNTLYHGALFDDVDQGPGAVELRRFNAALAADPRVVCVQTTIRDGVTLIRRADA